MNRLFPNEGRGYRVKNPPFGRVFRRRGWSVLLGAGFFYLARTDAPRTHVQADMGAVSPDCPYRLQIRLGHLFCSVVGMTHLVAAEPAFPANITRTCHRSDPPCIKYFDVKSYKYHMHAVLARKKCHRANKVLDLFRRVI
jgi:hypothetical protein